uniref:Ureide permease 2-like n=1 Tax=Oryza brachyantha TaxID=4533 RepID=J3NDM1_ORYBR
MFAGEGRGGAVAMMAVSLVFLGTWPALLTFLERRGRLPQHTYLDYSLANLLAAAVVSMAFGQAGGSSPSFFTQLTQASAFAALFQDNWPSILFAMAGGVALSIGNLISQYAWAFVGLSLTNIICSSLAVVLGTTINYFLDGRINRADILFPGVACFLVAVFLGSAVHTSNAKDEEEKLSVKSEEIELSCDVSDKVMLLPDQEALNDCDGEDCDTGTAEFIIQVEKRRSIKILRNFCIAEAAGARLQQVTRTGPGGPRRSLLLPLLAGDQPGRQRPVAHAGRRRPAPDGLHRLLPLLRLLLRRRRQHQRLAPPPSTAAAYAGDWDGRQWALLAGLLCGFGNGLQFMGGQC